jgi:hypothetical protein
MSAWGAQAQAHHCTAVPGPAPSSARHGATPLPRRGTRRVLPDERRTDVLIIRVLLAATPSGCCEARFAGIGDLRVSGIQFMEDAA